MLKGLRCCDPFVWIIFKQLGEEVKARWGFPIVVAVPFSEVVGVLFEGG
jgi:hypothetical protein